MTATSTVRSLDTVLSIVADPHRRLLLRQLEEGPDDTADLTDLARVIATRTEINSTDRREAVEEIRGKLVHRHVPKLAEAGLVEYDSRSRTVRYYPDDDVEALLAFLAERFE